MASYMAAYKAAAEKTTGEDAGYKAAAEKTSVEDAALAAEEKRVDYLEAELSAAEARVEAAERRFQLANKKIAEELAKPLTEPAVARKAALSGEGAGLAEMEAKLPSDDIGPDAVSRGSKNTSARSEKDVNRDKWVANKAAEGRVRNQSTKLREKLRRSQRDKQMQFMSQAADDTEGGGEEKPAPAAAKAPAPVPTERSPLFESDEVKQGAKSLAERLACLKDRPNAAEKRTAALRVLTGDRESYFTFEPADVLGDLEKRGLVAASLASELRGLFKSESLITPPIPKEEWLAHAQKVSGVERKDDQPIKESEVQYLKYIDRIGLLSAQAELDHAQYKLEELLRHVDASLHADEDIAEYKAPLRADQKIDEDQATKLEAQFDPEPRSKGSKNTSAQSDKVNSKEKWLRERGTENRDFEKNVKARDARRGEARDTKVGSADVDDS